MKILIVKLTSMGDVLHFLPALTDIQKKFPDAEVDWMVEKSFSDIPTWHPFTNRTIEVRTREWRKLSWAHCKEFGKFVKDLRTTSYDVVIDAQGLQKSAILSRFAKTTSGAIRLGFDASSIKESLASYLYSKKVKVRRDAHAVLRVRQLCAEGLAYDVSQESNSIDYGLVQSRSTAVSERPYVMFFHGTTWSSKHIPDAYWRDLAQLAADDGYRVKLAWGNDKEKNRADFISQDIPTVEVLAKGGLTELAKEIRGAQGAIAVDTGLGHMAAAFGIPTLSLYGSTNAALTGALGPNQMHKQMNYPCSPCLLKRCDKLTQQVITPPCYQTCSPSEIWQSIFDEIA